jgi:hypothetical protein
VIYHTSNPATANASGPSPLINKPGAAFVVCSAGLELDVAEAPTGTLGPAATVEVAKPSVGATSDGTTWPDVGPAGCEGALGPAEGTGALGRFEDTAGGLLLSLPGLLGDDGEEGDGGAFAALDTGCLADVVVGCTRVAELVAAG